MGTNFYARIIPHADKVEELKKAIDKDSFLRIENLVRELYGKRNSCDQGLIVHLGKRSRGWKFLWNPNVQKKSDGYYDWNANKWVDKWKYDYVYPLTKKGITDFLKRDDVIIFSEYYDPEEENHDPDDCPNADDFLEMAFEWGQKDGWDAKTYHRERPEERVYHSEERNSFWRELGYDTNYGHDFYSDGLRFSTSIEFS